MSEGEKCEACGDPLGEHHPTEVALGLCYHGYSVHERETGHSIEECFGPRGHLFRDAELEGEGSEGVKYRVHWADEGLPEETAIATGAARLLEVNGEEVLYIVREDQKLYPWSPREFYERVLDIWEERTGVNGKPRVVTPADWKWSLEQALAELEGEGVKA